MTDFKDRIKSIFLTFENQKNLRKIFKVLIVV